MSTTQQRKWNNSGGQPPLREIAPDTNQRIYEEYKAFYTLLEEKSEIFHIRSRSLPKFTIQVEVYLIDSRKRINTAPMILPDGIQVLPFLSDENLSTISEFITEKLSGTKMSCRRGYVYKDLPYITYYVKPDWRYWQEEIAKEKQRIEDAKPREHSWLDEYDYYLCMMNDGGMPQIFPSNDLAALEELLSKTYCDHYYIKNIRTDETLKESK
jgi:hypothetical protein